MREKTRLIKPKLSLSILLALMAAGLLACDCPPLKKELRDINVEAQYVDDVFIGDIVWFNQDSSIYKIVVCEVFKGKLSQGQVIYGSNEGYCGPYVTEQGEWILLGTYKDNFRTNDCGLSTLISFPHTILFPPDLVGRSHKINKQVYENWKMEAKVLLQKQIKTLRNSSQK